MGRRLVVVGVALLAALMWGAHGAQARPVGQPGTVEVYGLDTDTPDMAVLRWKRGIEETYRLCFSTNYLFRDWVSCSEIGATDSWLVGAPDNDGAVLYLSLQACRDDECGEPAPAGAIGRRARDGWDFYAVAFPLPDGRTRLGGFVRSGPARVAYYRGAAGAADLLDSACASVEDNTPCGATDVFTPGSLVGVGAGRAGAGERGITFQVRAQPTIYFMFDDGTGIVSGGKYVMQSIMDEFGVKGSFFLTGRAMQTYPGAVRALVAAGHRVGNHTWSHPFLTQLSDTVVGNELDLAEQQYRALIPGGTLKPCFRAPNGDFNARVLNVVRGRGYQQYTQTISSMDYARASAAQIVRNVMGEARDGALVSFHTQEQQTAIALRTLIPMLLAEGYRFGLPC